MSCSFVRLRDLTRPGGTLLLIRCAANGNWPSSRAALLDEWPAPGQRAPGTLIYMVIAASSAGETP
jgi:hypothetical protein